MYVSIISQPALALTPAMADYPPLIDQLKKIPAIGFAGIWLCLATRLCSLDGDGFFGFRLWFCLGHGNLQDSIFVFCRNLLFLDPF